jgi:hypothetical protein
MVTSAAVTTRGQIQGDGPGLLHRPEAREDRRCGRHITAFGLVEYGPQHRASLARSHLVEQQRCLVPGSFRLASSVAAAAFGEPSGLISA